MNLEAIRCSSKNYFICYYIRVLSYTRALDLNRFSFNILIIELNMAPVSVAIVRLMVIHLNR
jgi:hypothetical protein